MRIWEIVAWFFIGSVASGAAEDLFGLGNVVGWLIFGAFLVEAGGRVLGRFRTRLAAPAATAAVVPSPVISAGSIRVRNEHPLVMNQKGLPSLAQMRALVPDEDQPLFYNVGDFHFHFALVRSGGVYRIDIQSSPDYQGRPADGHSTHRILFPGKTPFICIKSGHEPREAAVAAVFAIDWARRTTRYIKNGQPWNA